MKKFILAATIALTGTISMAAPSHAEKLIIKYPHKHGYQNTYNPRQDVAATCWVKRKALVDVNGNVYVKRVRYCV